MANRFFTAKSTRLATSVFGSNAMRQMYRRAAGENPVGGSDHGNDFAPGRIAAHHEPRYGVINQDNHEPQEAD